MYFFGDFSLPSDQVTKTSNLYKRRLLCVQGSVGNHCTTQLGFISPISVHTVPLGGAVYTLHTVPWQPGHVSSYRSPVLMALLMYATVQGDREQWFWGLVWAQKVEQLNAALSLPLRLLHIQQVTHFFLPSPQPDTSLCFLEGGVGFLGEEKGTIMLFPHSWLTYWKDSHWGRGGGSWKSGSDLPEKGNSSSTTGLLAILSKWVIHEHTHVHTRTYARTATLKQTL